MSWFKRNPPAPPPYPPEIQRQVDDRVNELRGQYTPGRRPIGEWVERQYAVIDQIRAFAFAEGFEEGVAGAHADNWERRAFCGHAQAFHLAIDQRWLQLYCGREPGHIGEHCGLSPRGDRWQWLAGEPETYRPLVDFRAEDFVKVTPTPLYDVAGVAEMNDLARKALSEFTFETPRGGVVFSKGFTPTGEPAAPAPATSIEERVQALEARLEKLGSLLKLDNA